MPERDVPHGSYSRYLYGCRCDACREASRERQKKSREDRKARGLPPGDARHGLASTANNWGCMCKLCSEALAEYRRQRFGPPQVPRWTPEEEQAVKALSPKAAAEKVGRTVNAVYQHRGVMRQRGEM